jgi:hypothetical protein
MWYEEQGVVYSEERDRNVSRQDRQDRQGRTRRTLFSDSSISDLGDLGDPGERYSCFPFLLRKQPVNNTL